MTTTSCAGRYRRCWSGTASSVESVSSADAGLSLLRGGRRFDAIVTDMLMPGTNGIDLLRRIRDVDLDVPVIVLTGSPSLEDAVSAVQYGAFRYLQKPSEVTQLASTVREAAAMHRLAVLKRRAFEEASDPGVAAWRSGGTRGALRAGSFGHFHRISAHHRLAGASGLRS